MVIFNSYVKLPECTINLLQHYNHYGHPLTILLDIHIFTHTLR